jgi:major type 1 subunit fimbrin (pilin)
MKKTLLAAIMVPTLFVASQSFADEGDGPVPINVNGGVVQFSGSIVNSPCSISTGTESQTVELGQYRAADFTEIGDTSPATGFNITLKDCSVETYGTVAVTFNGNAVSNDTLAVEGGADGVGIQIVKDGKTLSVNGEGSSEPTNIVEGADNNIYFQAQYVSLAKTVTAGAANAVADFVLNYK